MWNCKDIVTTKNTVTLGDTVTLGVTETLEDTVMLGHGDTGGHGDIGDIVMLGDMVVTPGDTVTFLLLSVPQLGPRKMLMAKSETANQVGRKGALGKARRRKSAQLRGRAPVLGWLRKQLRGISWGGRG